MTNKLVFLLCFLICLTAPVGLVGGAPLPLLDLVGGLELADLNLVPNAAGLPLPIPYNGLKFENLLAYNALLQGLLQPVSFLAPVLGGGGGLPIISTLVPGANPFSLVQALFACVQNLGGLGSVLGSLPVVGGLVGLLPVSCVFTLVGTTVGGDIVTRQVSYVAPTLTQRLLGGGGGGVGGALSPFQQTALPDLTGLTQLVIKDVKPAGGSGGGGLLGGLLGGGGGANPNLLMRLPVFS